MFEYLKSLFKNPTDEEAYESGKKTVDVEMSQTPHHKQELANKLYGLASGGFNTKPHHNAYDRGVRDRLYELGYKDPSCPGEFY